MREDRRVVPVERVGERRDVSPRRDRRQRDICTTTVGLLEREPRGTGLCGDSEPGENLGREQEVRREPEDVRGIVAGRERPNELEHPVDRGPLDRDEATAHKVLVLRVHDEHAVRELVETQRIEVELTRVRRIAGEQARVAVPWAEQRDQPEQPDEKLVPRQARRLLGQAAHLGLEPLPRDAAERIGVDLLDLLAELADVVRRGR